MLTPLQLHALRDPQAYADVPDASHFRRTGNWVVCLTINK